jgi:hypothetical protein
VTPQDAAIAADLLQRADDDPAAALALTLRTLAARGIPSADLLAETLAILAGAGIEFAVHAAGPWRWVSNGQTAERRRLGIEGLRSAGEVVPFRRTRWCGVVGMAAAQTHYLDADGEGFATPEAAAEAVDRWLTTDRGLLGPRWALAPGGLPPRP